MSETRASDQVNLVCLVRLVTLTCAQWGRRNFRAIETPTSPYAMTKKSQFPLVNILEPASCSQLNRKASSSLLAPKFFATIVSFTIATMATTRVLDAIAKKERITAIWESFNKSISTSTILFSSWLDRTERSPQSQPICN